MLETEEENSEKVENNYVGDFPVVNYERVRIVLECVSYPSEGE